MDAVIVDTNVIVIANDTDDERADCRDRCQDRLQQIIDQQEKVVIDNKWRILGGSTRIILVQTPEKVLAISS